MRSPRTRSKPPLSRQTGRDNVPSKPFPRPRKKERKKERRKKRKRRRKKKKKKEEKIDCFDEVWKMSNYRRLMDSFGDPKPINLEEVIKHLQETPIHTFSPAEERRGTDGKIEIVYHLPKFLNGNDTIQKRRGPKANARKVSGGSRE